MAAQRVAIDPEHLDAAEMLGQRLFDALGAGTQRFQPRRCAVRAAIRHAPAATAVVADQPVCGPVPGQMGAAVRAVGLPAAFVAHHHRGEAAPVAVDQDLPALGQGLPDPLDQAFGQAVAGRSPARVDDAPGR